MVRVDTRILICRTTLVVVFGSGTLQDQRDHGHWRVALNFDESLAVTSGKRPAVVLGDVGVIDWIDVGLGLTVSGPPFKPDTQ